MVRNGSPALVDLYPPQVQQVFRDIGPVRVPAAPAPQFWRGLIFAGTQAKFLHLLLKLCRQARNGRVRLTPVGIAATTHTILHLLRLFPKISPSIRRLPRIRR